MSKDKGTKNHKKAPADKTKASGKSVSAYKTESKSGQDKHTTIEAFVPKQDKKGG
jgi:hypothetical protein